MLGVLNNRKEYKVMVNAIAFYTVAIAATTAIFHFTLFPILLPTAYPLIIDYLSYLAS